MDNAGNTALHKAVNNAACVELLLKFKATVNTPNNQDVTPLHLSCINRHEPSGALSDDVFHRLIKAGADCTMRTASGDNALHLLARAGKIDQMRFILENGYINQFQAANGRNLNDGSTALHKLVDGIASVDLRLQNAFDIQAQMDTRATRDNGLEKTAMKRNSEDESEERMSNPDLAVMKDCAAVEGNSQEILCTIGSRPDRASTKAIIELLIRHEVDLDAVDAAFGQTALLKAIRYSLRYVA